MKPKPESGITPLVKVGKRTGNNAIVPNAVTNVVGYALCKTCNQLLSSYVHNWAKKGLRCTNCKTITHYIANEWRKKPLVFSDDPFNVVDYFPKDIVVRGWERGFATPEPAPTPTTPQGNGIYTQIADNLSLCFTILKEIRDELRAINEKWS